MSLAFAITLGELDRQTLKAVIDEIAAKKAAQDVTVEEKPETVADYLCVACGLIGPSWRYVPGVRCVDADCKPVSAYSPDHPDYITMSDAPEAGPLTRYSLIGALVRATENAPAEIWTGARKHLGKAFRVVTCTGENEAMPDIDHQTALEVYELAIQFAEKQ